jgi:hypothetical protein
METNASTSRAIGDRPAKDTFAHSRPEDEIEDEIRRKASWVAFSSVQNAVHRSAVEFTPRRNSL